MLGTGLAATPVPDGRQARAGRCVAAHPARPNTGGKDGKLWPQSNPDRAIATVHAFRHGARRPEFSVQMGVAGCDSPVAAVFLALEPALEAAGDGTLHFRQFHCRALD